MRSMQNGGRRAADRVLVLADLIASHVKSHVVEDFIDRVKRTYVAIGEVKATRGKFHTYFGMILDFSE
jgi:hypothetical protein